MLCISTHQYTRTHTHAHPHYTYIRPYVMHMSVYFYVLTETHFECGVCASVRDLIYRNLPYILQFSGYNSFCRFWPCAYLECGIKIYTDSLSQGTPESSLNTHEDLCPKDAPRMPTIAQPLD